MTTLSVSSRRRLAPARPASASASAASDSTSDCANCRADRLTLTLSGAAAGNEPLPFAGGAAGLLEHPGARAAR